MNGSSVRGAGKARGGATDTTMLFWKVIAANPGITIDEIWKQVEHGIPEGYVKRRFPKLLPDDSERSFARARRELLTHTLWQMCRSGTITAEDYGNNRHYTALREPVYYGNPDAIDVNGTKAAEHMAVADALRTVDRLLANSSTLRSRLGSRQIKAIETLAEAVRAKVNR